MGREFPKSSLSRRQRNHRRRPAAKRSARSVRELNCYVVLSGYPSPLYDELYADWRKTDFDIANHAAGGKKKARETERLWMNF